MSGTTDLTNFVVEDSALWHTPPELTTPTYLGGGTWSSSALTARTIFFFFSTDHDTADGVLPTTLTVDLAFSENTAGKTTGVYIYIYTADNSTTIVEHENLTAPCAGYSVELDIDWSGNYISEYVGRVELYVDPPDGLTTFTCDATFLFSGEFVRPPPGVFVFDDEHFEAPATIPNNGIFYIGNETWKYDARSYYLNKQIVSLLEDLRPPELTLMVEFEEYIHPWYPNPIDYLPFSLILLAADFNNTYDTYTLYELGGHDVQPGRTIIDIIIDWDAMPDNVYLYAVQITTLAYTIESAPATFSLKAPGPPPPQCRWRELRRTVQDCV